MSKIKVVTHVLAGAAVAIAGFFVTPAGQAIIKQYPVLSPIAAGLALVLSLYHDPKAE